MENKTVIITGAHGFIGRHVAKVYRMNGWRVIGLGHGTWTCQEWGQWGLNDWHECDITLENLYSYCGKPNSIVHCAGSGSVGFSINYPMQDFARTVITMQHVLEFVRLYSPETKIVYPSSAAVYGMAKEMPISEDCLLDPISPYGVHKKNAEELCSLYARQYNISIAIVRLFSIYGEGLQKQLLWDACIKLGIDDTKFLGTGLETRDWVHVKDAAALLYLAYTKASVSCAIVNGGTGVSVTVEEILSILFVAFGSKDKPLFLKMNDTGNPVHYQADVCRLKEWNWEPKINLHQGIYEYVQWYKRIIS